MGGAGAVGDVPQYHLRAILTNKDLGKEVEEQTFTNFEEMQKHVEVYSLSKQSEKKEAGEIKLLEKVILTLPQEQCTKGGLFEGVQAESLKVLDIPGVEDGEFADKIVRLIKKKKASILPIFLLNLDAGTADLTEFQKIREVYQDSHDDTVLPVIFTKLSHAIKNANNQLRTDGVLEGVDPEQERKMTIERTQKHIHKLRDDIRATLKNSKFFIFDPTCTGVKQRRSHIKKYWALKDSQDLTFIEDCDYQALPEGEKGSWYAVN